MDENKLCFSSTRPTSFTFLGGESVRGSVHGPSSRNLSPGNISAESLKTRCFSSLYSVVFVF
jgi:hypothetical protein